MPRPPPWYPAKGAFDHRLGVRDAAHEEGVAALEASGESMIRTVRPPAVEAAARALARPLSPETGMDRLHSTALPSVRP